MGTWSTNGYHSAGGPATVNTGCYGLRLVMSTAGWAGNIALRKVILQKLIAPGYWLGLGLCGRSERAIRTNPPTSRISITMVLNRVAPRK